MPSVIDMSHRKSQIRRKLGLALASHTPNGDLVPRDQPDSSCNAALTAWRFLGASIMRRTPCPERSFTYSIVDMSDERTGQSMDTVFF